jgi:hypothetical protein
MNVWFQVIVALKRFGFVGNGACNGKVAHSSGIGNGTVNLYTQLIIALLAQRDSFVKWPNRRQRRLLSNRFEQNYGLLHCVGIVDGTPIIFSQRPAEDGGSFWKIMEQLMMTTKI